MSTKKVLQNYAQVKIGEKTVDVVVPLKKIVGDIKDNLDDTPLINVHGALMGVKDPIGVPTYQDLMPIKTVSDMTAWCRWHYTPIWTGSELMVPGKSMKTKPVGWSDLKSALTTRIPHHKAVEIVPHYPPIPDHFYLADEKDFSRGDGKALAHVVDHFNPETEEDRDLLKALILTVFWGGPYGARPLFLITSDHGRGVGKSTTVELIAEIAGGLTQIDAERESAATLARKTGTPEEVPKRCILIDNVKKLVDSATFEAMITASTIAADRLYHGSFQPPNVKTWIMTLNGPSASTDIASRAVVIKIGPPPHGEAKATFKRDLIDFIRDNRKALITDILDELRSTPSCQIKKGNQTRWSGWQSAVLTRFDNGNDLATLIQSRRGQIDTEAQEAEDLIHIIKTVLTANGIDPPSQNVCIPYGEIVDPVMEYVGDRSRSARKFWGVLKPYFHSDPFRRWGAKKGRSSSRTQRGLVWQPKPDDKVPEWDEAKDLKTVKFPSPSPPPSKGNGSEALDHQENEDEPTNKGDDGTNPLSIGPKLDQGGNICPDCGRQVTDPLIHSLTCDL